MRILSEKNFSIIAIILKWLILCQTINHGLNLKNLVGGLRQ